MNNEITIIDALKPPLLIRSVSGSAFYLLINGECQSVMAKNDLSFDAIITDPPYGLKKNLKGGGTVITEKQNSNQKTVGMKN